MGILLGAIADDFTGATDLANTLTRQGMRCMQTIGVPDDGFDAGGADAIVIALKSRTVPVAEAVSQSLAALNWLQGQGAQQIFFKYCSTFDSTDEGNIGPVADALLDAMGDGFTIACPAFPAAGRTIFKGHLFVGDVLLADSGMRNHPLTPMRDANLVKVLGRQTTHKVGLVQYADVEQGRDAVRIAFGELRSEGCRYAIVDAISDAHLMTIGAACAGLGLITGGSGVALGLPENFRHGGQLGESMAPLNIPASGRRAVLAGSCSEATRAQVALSKEKWPSFFIDPLAAGDAEETVEKALAWTQGQDGNTPLLFYSSQEPESVEAVQERLGREAAGAQVERVHAGIARGVLDAGFSQLIVAGGETSGAVVQALGVKALRIGPEIDPGVPWTVTAGDAEFALALKSGNFGGRDFFEKAFGMLA